MARRTTPRIPPQVPPRSAIPKTPGRRPDMAQLGVTGLVRYSGRVYDEWLPELQGPRGRRVFREMSDNDPIVGAFLFAVEMLIRQVSWEMQPGTEDQAGEEAAQFVNDCLHDMKQTWADTLSEILTCLSYGWSLHELVYKHRVEGSGKYSDGKIGWDSWPVRGQETLNQWQFDDNGDVEAMIQLGPPDWVFHTIPLEKALLFRPTSRRGNPEGRSVLRNSYRPWFFKKHIEVIEGIGIERDLAGLPFAEVPPEIMSSDATADEQAIFATIKEMVTNVRRDEQEGIVWPLAYDENGKELYRFSLLSTGGTRQFDTDKIIARYDQRIAMTVMADFIMLGHEAVGSKALSQDKSQMFTAAIGAWLEAICSVVNDTAIPDLLRYNGMPTDEPPKLAHGPIERVDLESLSVGLWNLAQAGFMLDVSPDGDLLRHILTSQNLPSPAEPDPDEQVEPIYKDDPRVPDPLPPGQPPGSPSPGQPPGQPGQPKQPPSQQPSQPKPLPTPKPGQPNRSRKRGASP